MKKINGYFIIIVIVGFFDLVYGAYTWYSKEKFISSANSTVGYIDMISKNKNHSVLSIHYYIKKEKYNGIIITYKDVKISDPIKIYYHPKNPKKISNGEIQHLEGLIIILGVILVFLGLLLSCLKDRGNKKKPLKNK